VKNSINERLHTAALVEPHGERRGNRRARKRVAARIEADARKAKQIEARVRWITERDQARTGAYLPAGGEPGAAQLRMPGRLRIPKHQDTSATLSGHYPFLAEAGLGSAGVFVGQDLYSGSSFVYDPWVLYQRGLITAPNIVLAGIVGSGKSALAKSLYTRSLPFGHRVYVPGDPKGEHTAVSEAVGGMAIKLGHGMRNRLNPLDEGHRAASASDEEWAAQLASRRRELIGALAETVLGRSLSPLEHTAIDLASPKRSGVRTFPSCPWLWTASSPRIPRMMRAGSPRTAASSATPCAASSPVTSLACSTGHPPFASTRHFRWFPSTSPGSPRTRPSSRC